MKILMTPEAAAEALSLGRTTTYKLIGSGAIRSVKIGRLRRVPADALADYVENLSTDGLSSLHSDRPEIPPPGTPV